MSQSTKDALMRYYQNQLPKTSTRKKKNGTPEKLVEKDVLLWCRNAGWFVGVFEAKSVYNKSAGVYISSTMEYGTPDILGISNNQTMVAIELKAVGRRSTLREAQRKYLIEVISRNGFAVVVDSVDLLAKYWRLYLGSINKKALLLSFLPKNKTEDNSPIFKED